MAGPRQGKLNVARQGRLFPAAENTNARPGAQLAALAVADPSILILVDAATPAAAANGKGHLFELFVAHLLAAYGFDHPSRERLNVTVDGVELDVSATHRLTGQRAYAECKAYTAPVRSELLAAFYGKLSLRRYAAQGVHGFFVALPRLTADAQQQAAAISLHDTNFTVLTAGGVVAALRDVGEISDLPRSAALTSDPAVLITEHGVYSACLELNSGTRIPSKVLVWARDRAVPDPVLQSLASDAYAHGAQSRTQPSTR